MNFRYNRTFSNNILVVGQMICGKTSFVQSLGKKRIFGDGLLKVDWISKIYLTKNREDKIKICFKYTHIEFHYPDDMDNFNLLIKTFQKETRDNDQEANNNNDNCIIFRENKKIDKLTVRDDVSGLADKSNDFSNFLTVSRIFGYICLYIFHIIYLTKSIWQMILSQTIIFNIFPWSIHLGNILKILTNNCDRNMINYIPARDRWINRLYFSLSNELKYSCLAINCRQAGPAKYRTNADSNFEQFCYYFQNKKDSLFNKFLAKRDEQNNSLVFQIDSVINVAKNSETKIYKAVQELKHLVKQNDGNDRGSEGKQIAEQPKLVDRKYFGEGQKLKMT